MISKEDQGGFDNEDENDLEFLQSSKKPPAAAGMGSDHQRTKFSKKLLIQKDMEDDLDDFSNCEADEEEKQRGNSTNQVDPKHSIKCSTQNVDS